MAGIAFRISRRRGVARGVVMDMDMGMCIMSGDGIILVSTVVSHRRPSARACAIAAATRAQWALERLKLQ